MRSEIRSESCKSCDKPISKMDRMVYGHCQQHTPKETQERIDNEKKRITPLRNMKSRSSKKSSGGGGRRKRKRRTYEEIKKDPNVTSLKDLL